MTSKKQVAVVIPFYKPELTRFEEISLTQCLKVLSAHPVFAIKPESLDLTKIQGNHQLTGVECFEDSYFDGIQGYNKLMLSPDFYDRFLDYEFILIHQLDAFVFRDELLQWCSKGFDYIGAPWLKRLANPDFVKEWKTRLNTRYHIFVNTLENDIPSDRQFDNMVGNGGFSLRRVKRLYDLSIKLAPQINQYHKREEHQFHEDVFWSIEANRKWRRLKIPLYKTALRFSFENRLKQSMMHNSNQLPFGCHAWDQHVKFWTPYFKELGYDIAANAQ
ncbi:DUF5672 family protein [Dyadobacter psychrotolerans]|uniref:DUF5672 domain-containing protein n=1 Tax=Dyadobacter psychrotolerans TaxID=2541721 RepID=A0A4R5DMQ9_9BACT|nr:DUF5672 family protein [Dyadobacter psychrotolerans]TDE15439.1 hypothetical protein E0F88_13075 [Dyadobacter psychrotolerans]